uniref:Transmembrane and coiled-coil domains protein 1 n=1 Tax=Cacopsylla melanoneura TaxID=428564 RepID=A0A8D8Y7X4_9HEMI
MMDTSLETIPTVAVLPVSPTPPNSRAVSTTPSKASTWTNSRSSSPARRARTCNSLIGSEESRMSRCKSPLTIRHERGGSADTGLIRVENVSSQGSNDDDQDLFYGASSTYLSNGSSELVEDVDGGRVARKHIQSKIDRTMELIKNEQTSRDDNVNEYLKLASNADKSQAIRIKAMFEKRNQKSAQNISQLQKKLEGYTKKLRMLETQGVAAHHRQPREVLRDMGQGLRNVGGNIRDGITGLSGSVMSKPREFAHLIRNKFGSADNINSMTRNGESDPNTEDSDRCHHGSATFPGGCSRGSSSAAQIKFGASDEGSECSSVSSESGRRGRHPHSSSPHSNPPATSPPAPPPNMEALLSELRLRREDNERLRNKLEHVRQYLSKNIDTLNHNLLEEKFRIASLEEQINDLTELHQNEMENLKQNISDMEEKVQYQSEERLRDICDMLEACQTKISKMEHQQAQHQQYLTLEGLDNSNARALFVKLINVVLTVLQVVLLVVATAAGIMMPFLRTRLRILSTTVLVAAIVIMMKQWPEVTSLAEVLSSQFKHLLTIK